MICLVFLFQMICPEIPKESKILLFARRGENFSEISFFLESLLSHLRYDRKVETFFNFLIYSQLCAIVGGGLAIHNIITDDDDDIEIPQVVNATVLVAPNILLQIFWAISMKKACTRLSRFFEWQNQKVYFARGICWQTCKTLMYIQISIVNAEVLVYAKC